MTIFIGNDTKEWLPSEVLRSSILSRTSFPVEFKELHHFDGALPFNFQHRDSFLRWSIPFFQHYKGRAVYIENASLVFDDIQKLFEMDMGDSGFLARSVENPPGTGASYTNVLLMDCDRLQHFKLEEWVHYLPQYPDLMTKLSWVLPGGLNHDDVGPLDPNWNRIGEVTPDTKIFHYQNSHEYPWKKRGGVFQELFLKELRHGVESGRISLDGILHEIQLSHAYPQVIEDMMK